MMKVENVSLNGLQQNMARNAALMLFLSAFSTANAFSTVARVNQMHTPETLAINELPCQVILGVL